MSARRKLTKRQREQAAMRRLEGASLRAIGHELGVAHPTVKRALEGHAGELARAERDRKQLELEGRRTRRKRDTELTPEHRREPRPSGSSAIPAPTEGVSVRRRSDGSDIGSRCRTPIGVN